MRISLLAAFLLAATGVAEAADTLAPISERYRTADAPEATAQPDFRRHVVPLLGKLGCNGRACHGSFQGQGGFRLSLFGYDFKLDHEQMTAGDNPRVDTDVPEESLVIQKPTLGVPHKGGKRFELGSWQHTVLQQWIKGGAKGLAKEAVEQSCVLEITPNDIQFTKAGDSVQLKVLARWSTGEVEDVTPLCRFQTNNEQIATIDAGLVTAADAGDTHVVVFYDNAVVPIPVMRPVTEIVGDKYPQTPTPTEIDRLVVEKLKRLGIVQSETCTDAEFLRRVSLDVTGTLPTPREIEAFLADSSSDKRQKKIDELLERPTYAAWWSTKLCDITGNNDSFLNNIGLRNGISNQWYDWIHKRVKDNVPYDKLVEGIVLAKSRSADQSFEDYSKSMSELYHKGSDKSFADFDGLTYFWARRNFRTPNERALGFAYTFLGIRIQCAECHKHPFDQWTQDDYKQFTGFFTRTQFGRNPESRKDYETMLASLNIDEKTKKNGNEVRRELLNKAQAGETVPFEELYVAKPQRQPNRRPQNRNQKNPRPQTVATAKLLGADKVEVGTMDDPRQALMDWLRKVDNPYFARAFVNRVWASYFNVGIVQPADDLSLANPPSNRALLDYLSKGFIDHGYDMKWLHREICNSRTYQLSWNSNETNARDDRNFSRAVPRRLPAEVAVDIVYQATCADAEFELLQTDLSKRAIAIPGTTGRTRAPRAADASFALTVFGRSTRESNCDCDRSSEASLLQTIYLHNDNDVLTAIDRRGGWVDQVLRQSGSSNPKAVEAGRNPRRPADFDNRVAQMKKQIEKLRESDSKKADRLEDRLKNYVKQFGGEKKSETDKPAEGEKVPPKFNTAEVVKAAYLRTLSRLPTDGELERSTRFIFDSNTPDEGLRGLLWALLNTKEFIVNH